MPIGSCELMICVKNQNTGAIHEGFDYYRHRGDHLFFGFLINNTLGNIKWDCSKASSGPLGAIRPICNDKFITAILESELPNKKRFIELAELLHVDRDLAINFMLPTTI